jgi:transcriptional regulator with XRE-family HTH domain
VINCEDVPEEGAMPTIRELRKAHNMTQLELAIRVGVTPKTVYSWEVGEFKPRHDQLRKLSELLGIPMDEIAFPERTQQG